MIIVNGEESFDLMGELRNYMEENFDDSVFDEVIDETEEPVLVCGMEYLPSTVLKAVDPIAYRCAKLDYFDSVWGDVEYNLERYGESDFNGFSITMEEEEEEEE